LDLSLESSNGKGLSAAVIMPDGEIWSGVCGVSHGKTKITKEMRFSAGSIEKMFAATTILQLAEEGRLTLEDPLYKWLPAYPYVDSNITIRQLLNHTSGLYHYVNNRDFWDAWFKEPSKFWTLEGIVLTFNREPYFPRGTGWHYSQTGYNLLRMIIKKITGLEISTVNRDRFFVPLGLNNTFTSMGETLPGNIAHGWYDTDNDLEYEDFFSIQRTPFASGIGGEVWSTAEDLAKWARKLFHDISVVSQGTLDQMLTFYSPCTGEEFFCAGYGLGVGKFNPELVYGLEAYGHGGHGPGYAAGCIYLPDYKVCIGILDNTDGGECIGTCLAKLIKVITSHLDTKSKSEL
jgi:D-alanyl-D-alanine carboxypeptidase